MRNARNRRGATAIEFALTVPMILFMVGAVVDWGAYMSLRTSVARAATAGARRGAAVFEPVDEVDGTLIVPAAEKRAILVLTEMGLGCTGTCVVEGEYCSAGEGGDCGEPPLDTVLLRVTYPYTPMFGLAAAPTVITERSTFVVEAQ